MNNLSEKYFFNISKVLKSISKTQINLLIKEIHKLKNNNKRLFICGNGGSAANAIHVANDFLFTKLSNKNCFFSCNLIIFSSIVPLVIKR